MSFFDDFFDTYRTSDDCECYAVSDDNGATSCIVYNFALPGRTKDSIHVTLSGDQLVVKADAVKVPEGVKMLSGEIYKGSRAFSIRVFSDLEDVEGISTKYENGLLSISIPLRRIAEKTEKTIEIM